MIDLFIDIELRRGECRVCKEPLALSSRLLTEFRIHVERIECLRCERRTGWMSAGYTMKRRRWPA